jgi:hypothetical protein
MRSWLANTPMKLTVAFGARSLSASRYQGYLVADAHSVYDHLYADGTVVEVACWAHYRRYSSDIRRSSAAKR